MKLYPLLVIILSSVAVGVLGKFLGASTASTVMCGAIWGSLFGLIAFYPKGKIGN